MDMDDSSFQPFYKKIITKANDAFKKIVRGLRTKILALRAWMR